MVDEVGDGLFGAVGLGLAELIVLAKQLNVNQVFSYSECGEKEGEAATSGGGFDSDCVVCLYKGRAPLYHDSDQTKAERRFIMTPTRQGRALLYHDSDQTKAERLFIMTPSATIDDDNWTA
ncbi:hypothetical protein NE237_007657 [Protea cynaroides]|uniref:Uncharacterized protein n=1 Tax=Protea cynaroides TaxID=273540 RepID=A0A9Q0KPN6_9MAGN|nr:hypothetical protein NE237_007657 [Protea cynaroides]